MVMIQRKHRRKEEEPTPPPPAASQSTPVEAAHPGDASSSFAVAKHLICTLLGLVYLFAFLAAYRQNRALLGSGGLAPFRDHVERGQAAFAGDARRGFLHRPSVWWVLDRSDDNLDRVALAGLAAAAVATGGGHYAGVFAACWLLYFSVVEAGEGSSFYSYGWESQLLETGFLAVFLCSWNDRRAAPSLPILWLFRWLCFRISIGAGLIKIRGGSCWAKKECLWYHFETQPVPSPLSFAFHFLPRPLLSRGVDVDLFVQLYTSCLVLAPGWGALRHARRAAGAVQAGFMVAIAASGNFSILNHLTVVPALACLDDGVFRRTAAPARRKRSALRWLADLAVVGVVGWLSRPVVANLLQTSGRGQVMNASFDPWRLVNTYGAFGSVGERRYEPVVSLSPDGGATWTELEFPCKPGDVARRPCFSAPYHHRLDWNIWFIGFKPHQQMLRGREQWLYAFLAKLLDGDALARSLLAPASRDDAARLGGGADARAKVDMYHYEMRAPLWDLAGEALRELGAAPVVWWNRTFTEVLIPPVKLTGGHLTFAVRPGIS